MVNAIRRTQQLSEKEKYSHTKLFSFLKEAILYVRSRFFHLFENCMFIILDLFNLMVIILAVTNEIKWQISKTTKQNATKINIGINLM